MPLPFCIVGCSIFLDRLHDNVKLVQKVIAADWKWQYQFDLSVSSAKKDSRKDSHVMPHENDTDKKDQGRDPAPVAFK